MSQRTEFKNETNSCFSGLKLGKPKKEQENLDGTPYLLCNEQEQKEILTKILNLKKASPQTSRPRVHIGFSVWFNLDIIANTQPDCAVILDIDPNVIATYQKIEEAFKDSSVNTPAKFVGKLMELLKKEGLLYFPEDYFFTQTTFSNFVNELRPEFADRVIKKTVSTDSEKGFLFSQSKFEALQKMIRKGAISFGYGNLSNADVLNSIGSWVKAMNLQIETLYLSNILEWLLTKSSNKENVVNIVKSIIGSLVHKETCVIDAFYTHDKGKNSGPPQRIMQGSAFGLKQFGLIEKEKDEEFEPQLSTLFNRENREFRPSIFKNHSNNSSNSVVHRLFPMEDIGEFTP